MYRWIAEDFRQRIESGELAPGSQLPNELELREEYSASRNTVRDAIRWLTNLGLVENRPGRGTFVVNKVDPFVTTLSGDPKTGFGGGEGYRFLSEACQRNRTVTTSPVQVEIQQASAEVAASLKRPERAEVISRSERRYIDSVPWSMQTSFYPMEFADRGAERLRSARNLSEGTVRYLAEALGIEQAGYRDRLLVRAPKSFEAEFFKVPADGRTPVVEMHRIAFDGDGRPIRLTVTVYPADRNQFIFDFGQVPQSNPDW
jgi:GntR family transcriptional regulator